MDCNDKGNTLAPELSIKHTLSMPRYVAVSMHYILMAESSTVLTRTPNLLFTVMSVFSVRVTLPPSFTMYTSGSKYTPATASEGRGQWSEVSRKGVAMPARNLVQTATVSMEHTLKGTAYC